jgi:serine/threonine protein kinase
VYSCRLRPEVAADPQGHPFADLPADLCVKVYKASILGDAAYNVAQMTDRENVTSAFVHPHVVRTIHTFKERARKGDAHYSSVHAVLERALGVPDDLEAFGRLSPKAQAWFGKELAPADAGGVNKPDLYSYVVTRGGLDERRLRHVLWQLLSALMFLHEQPTPLVHRDIKLENAVVFAELRSGAEAEAGAVAEGSTAEPGPAPAVTPATLAPVPVVKLADFGIAKALQDVQGRADVVMGTRVGVSSGAAADFFPPDHPTPLPTHTPAPTLTQPPTPPAFPHIWQTGLYWAPEVHDGEAYNFLADIYSTAVLALAASSGTVPDQWRAYPLNPFLVDRIGKGMSDAGRTLVKAMGSARAADRPTARECLRHAFFDPVRTEALALFGDDTLLQVVRDGAPDAGGAGDVGVGGLGGVEDAEVTV